MTVKEFSSLSYKEKVKFNLPVVEAFTKDEKIEMCMSDNSGYVETNTLNYIHIYPYRVADVVLRKHFYLYIDKKSKKLTCGQWFSNVIDCEKYKPINPNLKFLTVVSIDIMESEFLEIRNYEF